MASIAALSSSLKPFESLPQPLGIDRRVPKRGGQALRAAEDTVEAIEVLFVLNRQARAGA